MLNQVRITAFRCLSDVDVSLKPLTVLIGNNDTGKSAFLGAIRYLTNTVNGDGYDHPALTGEIDVWGRVPAGEFRRRSVGPESVNAAFRNQLLPTQFFQLPSSGVQTISQGASGLAAPGLVENGHNLAALIDHYLRYDRERFQKVEAAIRQHVPGVEQLQIGSPNDPSQRQIELQVQGVSRPLPADRASTGVRLLLFFIALAYHPTPPKLILLEEPENGVHPKRLQEIVQLLRSITEGKHGSYPAQVILTTHSPYLLDAIDLARDQVLVFRRQKDGHRSVQPVDKARLDAFMNDFMLGEVWFTEGEEGLVAAP